MKDEVIRKLPQNKDSQEKINAESYKLNPG
jgi:hypothetical protein